ncbi:TIGR02117 family protein [Sphingomonas sp. JC676]|uniref:TIGR02117 family protein n=1 Tax=Sphingomonas sp. JC676 TaxID=2768065 RepID=UPI001657F32A|nr:TIGR02117 family protein [Sphingomonas sp. JC676]MBC9034142.1 TIGR02117 family protein [Sphingomonas sp. JC676]
MPRNRTATWTRRELGLAVLLVALVVAYPVAALIGGAIPVNSNWRQADAGVRIYVIDNGIHSDLVLPVVAQGVDWREQASPADLRNPAQGGHSHMAFGWGNRDFYLKTPSWSAISPGRTVRALSGIGPTVLHVTRLPEPQVGPKVRALMLRPEEYRRLVAFIRGTFTEGPRDKGYGDHDSFYAARGHYSAFNTCNQWTSSGLRAAGVRMGAWTPFPFGVMQWL